MGLKERREREEQSRLATILSAAESIFAEKGYYETRMDDIALKAELSKGTLYYYFKSKDEIYVRLLETESKKVYEGIKSRLEQKTTSREILTEVTNFSVEYFKANLPFLKIFMPCMFGLVQFGDAQALRQSRRIFDLHGEHIREALQAALAREHVSLNLDDLLSFFKTLQMGLFLRLLEGSPQDAQETAKFFLQIIAPSMEKHP
jgi:AcrR family transcriptional regulator